jgi:hypothetical protein
MSCDCDAVAHLRFCHLGQFFVEPSYPQFHSKCGISKGLIKGEAQQISDGHGAEGRTMPTPHTLHYFTTSNQHVTHDDKP